MKNIKKAIFLSMLIGSYMFGMDGFSPVTEGIKAILSVSKIIDDIENSHNEQMRAKDVHKLSQHRTQQNHQQAHRITDENHEINKQQALNRLSMAQQNHEVNLEEAKFRQQVDKDNYRRQQEAESLAKMIELQDALINRQRQENNGVLSRYQSAIEIKRAQQQARLLDIEERLLKVEELFKQCLVDHKSSSDTTVSGIPAACENFGLELALFGQGEKVREMIAVFKEFVSH